MRVLWVHNFNDRSKSGGVFMYQLANALISDEDVEITLHSIPNSSNPLVWKREFKKLQAIVGNYDIVHAQYGSVVGFLACSVKHPNKILTLRGSDWYGIPIKKNVTAFFHDRMSKYFTKVAIRHAHQIIVMSKRMAKEISEGMTSIRNKAIHYVPDGISFKKFYPFTAAQKIQARVKLNLPLEAPIIGIGTISLTNPIKRVNLAVDAVNNLKAKINQIQLYPISGVNHDEMVSHVNACDVMLLTSTHEGWPNIIKEGLACNIPFVSTDVSDLKEIANNTPSCFVSEANSIDIAICLEKALQNRGNNDNLNDTIRHMAMDSIILQLKSIYND